MPLERTHTNGNTTTNTRVRREAARARCLGEMSQTPVISLISRFPPSPRSFGEVRLSLAPPVCQNRLGAWRAIFVRPVALSSLFRARLFPSSLLVWWFDPFFCTGHRRAHTHRLPLDILSPLFSRSPSLAAPSMSAIQRLNSVYDPLRVIFSVHFHVTADDRYRSLLSVVVPPAHSPCHPSHVCCSLFQSPSFCARLCC